jgi:3-oxoadipate enol-lactonase
MLRQMILKTTSGPLYFEIAGQGPPVVFVSGWAMSCECWRPVVSLLEEKYLCLIYDPRGTSRSQPVSVNARFDIEDHSEDLHSILKAAGIYDAAIVGHEIGWLVAALCADRHPQDAQSLVVVSPRIGMADDDIKKLAVFTPASLALRELASFPIIRNLVARRFHSAPDPFKDRLYEDFSSVNPRAAYETALSAANPELAARIELIVERAELPMLFVCGKKDKKGSSLARRLFTRARSARLATMSDCGFLPMLEYPQQFARLLDDFIGVGAPSSRQSLSRR